ncbi:hypothetical protein [Phreatobacter oligotrophus]|uniref:hypothetical protein n=1 Tax=Phreatobacter oligotrophus TaxID=1122261 RepID=UPI0023520D98|nr:hypothetical protein [Phreatobacter oligotrophus]MBX9990657.1 hypothetical protein [Phreatobacter oligotrophus]
MNQYLRTGLIAIASLISSALIVYVAAPALARILPAIGQFILALMLFILMIVMLGLAMGFIRVETQGGDDDDQR